MFAQSFANRPDKAAEFGEKTAQSLNQFTLVHEFRSIPRFSQEEIQFLLRNGIDADLEPAAHEHGSLLDFRGSWRHSSPHALARVAWSWSVLEHRFAHGGLQSVRADHEVIAFAAPVGRTDLNLTV